MYKKTVVYENYDGQQVEETLYFHLSELEMTRINFKNGGDVGERIQYLIATNDMDAMIQLLEEIVLSAYGVKSEDGKRFEKSKEAREAFSNSLAYSDLFMEMLVDPGAVQEFTEKALSKPKKRKIIKKPQDHKQKANQPVLDFSSDEKPDAEQYL